MERYKRLDRAFVRCLLKEYDPQSASRIQNGNQFSEKDLKTFLSDRANVQDEFAANEASLNLAPTGKLMRRQIDLVETYGFRSEFVWRMIADDLSRIFKQGSPRRLDVGGIALFL